MYSDTDGEMETWVGMQYVIPVKYSLVITVLAANNIVIRIIAV